MSHFILFYYKISNIVSMFLISVEGIKVQIEYFYQHYFKTKIKIKVYISHTHTQPLINNKIPEVLASHQPIMIMATNSVLLLAWLQKIVKKIYKTTKLE